MQYILNPTIAQNYQTLVSNVGDKVVSLIDEVVKATQDSKGAPGVTVKIPVATQAEFKRLHDEGHPFIIKSEVVEVNIHTTDKKA